MGGVSGAGNSLRGIMCSWFTVSDTRRAKCIKLQPNLSWTWNHERKEIYRLPWTGRACATQNYHQNKHSDAFPFGILSFSKDSVDQIFSSQSRNCYIMSGGCTRATCALRMIVSARGQNTSGVIEFGIIGVGLMPTLTTILVWYVCT